MEYTKIDDINEYISQSINPTRTPDTVFELYSVPAFETGHPEYLRGDEISSSKIVVDKNDVLLCKINPRINRVWVVADESDKLNIASSEWIVVRSSKYNPEYLAWYFRTPKFQKLMASEVTGIGGSLTRAQPKRVKQYPVPLVERELQDKVVRNLNIIKNIIQNRKQQLKDLDILVKSQFVEMFGLPTQNIHGYECGTIADIVTDVHYGTSRKAVDDGKYVYIRMNNITYEGELDLSEIKRIDIPDKEIEGCIVRYGDVLFNRTNSRELVGKTCSFKENENMVVAGYIIRLRMNGRVVSDYLSTFLNLKQSKKLLLSMAKGAVGQANINAKEVQSISIIIPPIEIQQQFQELKDQIDKLKATIQKSLDETQLLFDSLMQEYFG